MTKISFYFYYLKRKNKKPKERTKHVEEKSSVKTQKTNKNQSAR